MLALLLARLELGMVFRETLTVACLLIFLGSYRIFLDGLVASAVRRLPMLSRHPLSSVSCSGSLVLKHLLRDFGSEMADLDASS